MIFSQRAGWDQPRLDQHRRQRAEHQAVHVEVGAEVDHVDRVKGGLRLNTTRRAISGSTMPAATIKTPDTSPVAFQR
jgi:hypothetical protein